VARGTLRIRTTSRGETVFEVHRWPDSYVPFVCSSVCAGRERYLPLEPQWLRRDDAAEIHRRLTAAPGRTSGADKGRVLYVIERQPLSGGFRVPAAALLSADPRAVKLYRLCFSADALRRQHDADATLLVDCARALAAACARQLRMLVPPRAAAGDVAAQFHFTGGTFRDELGQVWVR